MTLSLYLLRHGETTASATGGFCGTSDPDLTPEGLRMAEDFGQVYQGHPWEGIYVSPMRRARQTAGPLCQAAGLEMKIRPGLSEVDFGLWEGMSSDWAKREHAADYLRWTADAGWNAPTGGERGVDVARRVLAVLDEIQREHVSGDVLVISHKATLRILICALLGIDIGGYRDRIDIPVASLAIVDFHSHGPRLARLGDRSHLRESLRQRPGT
jgi:probable phosphoglycerate mutase